MKVVQINSTCSNGSTGKICVSVSKLMNERNIENYIMYTGRKDACRQGIVYAGDFYIKAQALCSRLLGNYGFNSVSATRRLIAELDRIQPDIVHLHNLHGHNCNLTMLFEYLKKKKLKVFWTFHDCWAFTAYCPYFDMAGCDKWLNGCEHCVQRRRFSYFFDRSKWLYKKKRELFSGLDMTVITPSEWLAGLVKRSFLGEYPVHVINNGIDLDIFRPTPGDIRERYDCGGKFIILGVAFGWGKRKGLDVFIELARRLDASYRIILVGTDETVDKQLPGNIISIHRTKNQTELAKIYTASDLFVNPTREENYPTVNMEALACGTPVLSFRTGGSPECYDASCGSVVNKDDIDAMESEIIRISASRPFTEEACLRKAARFKANDKFSDYIDLYENPDRAE